MAHEWLFGAIVFGLAASMAWGSGDFSGGLASRKMHVFSVVTASYIAGLLLLPILALVTSEPFPSWHDTLWGICAGLAGMVGLTAFYRSLAIGNMGINSTIAAVLATGLPVIFSALYQGPPGALRLAGFVLALLAGALISRPGRMSGRPEGLGLALLAGLGFGGFLILIGQISVHSIYWPLAAARSTSLVFMIVFMRVRGQKIEWALLRKGPVLILLALAGALDVLGNVFFVLATHAGRLDIAAILSSLSPAFTVILAAIILKERVSRLQALGILLALAAIVLISA